MHAAGKVDFWWASLVFRTTALLLVAAAVAVQRPALRLRPARPRDRARGRHRRHARQRALRRVVGHGLVSLTAVLASLYPIVTVLLAAAVLHERVAPLQRPGIVLTLTGVALIGG